MINIVFDILRVNAWCIRDTLIVTQPTLLLSTTRDVIGSLSLSKHCGCRKINLGVLKDYLQAICIFAKCLVGGNLAEHFNLKPIHAKIGIVYLLIMFLNKHYGYCKSRTCHLICQARPQNF